LLVICTRSLHLARSRPNGNGEGVALLPERREGGEGSPAERRRRRGCAYCQGRRRGLPEIQQVERTLGSRFVESVSDDGFDAGVDDGPEEGCRSMRAIPQAGVDDIAPNAGVRWRKMR